MRILADMTRAATLATVSAQELRAEVAVGAATIGVDGLSLEGVWELETGWLIATTDDIPDEDQLHLTLWLRDGYREAVHLGGAYSTGHFRLMGRDADRSVSFSFFDTEVWTVKVLDAPRRQVPFFRQPPGLSRGFRFQTRLDITCRTA